MKKLILPLAVLSLATFTTLHADQADKAVAAGEEAPDFELTNQAGETIKLSDFRSKKNVVLAFTRAHW
jgi:cytochrome oxidase Cu insertion factor (SCO1/SenC/PrrC family)